MELPPSSSSVDPATKADIASDVGRDLARLVKKAKPHTQRLAAAAKPRVERATRDALALGRAHEGELKQVAQKLVRSRTQPPSQQQRAFHSMHDDGPL